MMKPGIISLLFSVTLILGASCSHRDDSGEEALDLTVSLEPQRQLLEEIGGERVKVSSLLANGADPETYDPTMASLIHLSKSAAWFQAGNMEFEHQLEKRLATTAADMVTVDTSEGINLIKGTHGHSHGHGHEEFDPHTWSSVRNMKIISATMLRTLLELDPNGEEYYRKRYEALTARLDSLDAEYSRRLKRAAGSSFMVWHPSLSYFARDYGLNQISVTADHREISLQDLERKIDEATGHGVRVFFEQSSYDPRLSATVRRHIGAECFTFNPLDYDWQKGLDTVVKALEDDTTASAH